MRLSFLAGILLAWLCLVIDASHIFERESQRYTPIYIANTTNQEYPLPTNTLIWQDDEVIAYVHDNRLHVMTYNPGSWLSVDLTVHWKEYLAKHTYQNNEIPVGALTISDPNSLFYLSAKTNRGYLNEEAASALVKEWKEAKALAADKEEATRSQFEEK